MKRKEILAKMGLEVPENRQVRVIVHSDVKNEADDHYAIVHHLLTPIFDVRGCIAAHFEGRYIIAKKQAGEGWEALKEESEFYQGEGTSMQKSYEEMVKLMLACDIDDVPMYKGCSAPLKNEEDAPDSEGVEMIIREAMREDERPLYLAMLGGVTDLAAALNKAPEIAGRMTVIWIGGGAYPKGGIEFNLMQDIHAVRKVFSSEVNLWQIPCSVYQEVEVTLADLALKVRPCGKIGRYLFEEMTEVNKVICQWPDAMRKGENWCLGDQPSVGVLLQNEERQNFHVQKAPKILDDMTYADDPDGREIRVYDSIDARLLLDDFYAKLKLCYS